METSKKQVQNIIVRMPNWLGDCVMASCIFKDIKNAYPNARITVMISSTLKSLIENDPHIDEVFSFTKPKSFLLQRQEHRDIVQTIKNGRYDLGLLLTNSFSSAWYFWQGDVKRRIGYSFFPRCLLLTDALKIPLQKMHQVKLYKNLLSALDIPMSKSKPQLFVSKEEKNNLQEVLNSFGYVEGKKIVTINPGAAYGSAKCWLPDRFKLLAQKLAQKDLFIVFVGDLKTDFLVRSICQDLPSNVINLSLKTNLSMLCALIERSDLLITNDSGPMHIGACFNTPLIALFGSTDVDKTGPYRENCSILNKKVPCSPCFKRTCPIDFPCMKLIEVDEVFKEAEKYV